MFVDLVFKYFALAWLNPARALGGAALVIVAFITAKFMISTIKKMIRTKKEGKERSLTSEIVTVLLFSFTITALFYAFLLSPLTSSIIFISILLGLICGSLI